MDTPETVAAAYWFSFWEWIGDKAFLIVVVALAIEFLAARWAKPHREALDHARELQIAQLVKDAVRLTTEGDVARKETASAQLQLGQLRKLAGPRGIKQEAFNKELEGKLKSPVQIWYLPEVSDGFWFANQLVSALISAKWDMVEPPTPIGPIQLNQGDRFIPPLMALGAQPSGITVVAHGVPADIDKEHPSQRALMSAISVSAELATFGSWNPSVPDGVLRIIIAAKQDPILPSAPAASAGAPQK